MSIDALVEHLKALREQFQDTARGVKPLEFVAVQKQFDVELPDIPGHPPGFTIPCFMELDWRDEKRKYGYFRGNTDLLQRFHILAEAMARLLPWEMLEDYGDCGGRNWRSTDHLFAPRWVALLMRFAKNMNHPLLTLEQYVQPTGLGSIAELRPDVFTASVAAIDLLLKAISTDPKEDSTVEKETKPEKARQLKKRKKGTINGEARPKIVGMLLEHHKYDSGSIGNYAPIGVRELAEKAEVSSSTVTLFFVDAWGKTRKSNGGWTVYRTMCLNPENHELLRVWLKALNGDNPVKEMTHRE
ncbi:MAG TPA: hypothetical protein PLN21_06595 [Gemmatales bacterium]|nr:hypothetical protein [Gemmatales bacterium]